MNTGVTLAQISGVLVTIQLVLTVTGAHGTREHTGQSLSSGQGHLRAVWPAGSQCSLGSLK